MDDIERASVERLIRAATDILEYVKDPDEAPPSYTYQTAELQMPRSSLQIKLQEAKDLERQSQRVRALKASLAEWGN